MITADPVDLISGEPLVKIDIDMIINNIDKYRKFDKKQYYEIMSKDELIKINNCVKNGEHKKLLSYNIIDKIDKL